jgi:hypothetical protein
MKRLRHQKDASVGCRPTLLTGLIWGLSLVLAACPVGAGVPPGLHANPTRVDDATGSQRVRIRVSGKDRCLRVTVAGVATRNAPPAPPTTNGIITLPEQIRPEDVVWAGMYWEVLGDSPPPSRTTLNGSPLSPIPLPAGPSPCWFFIQHAYPFFCEVTSLVHGGDNLITGLDDDGISPEYGYQAEGASLVVIYKSGDEGACEIIVLDGNDLLADTPIWDVPVPVSCGDGQAAILYFIGGDGQPGSDDQMWCGRILGDGDDFDNSDPHMPGAAPAGWDSDRWEVTTLEPNTASISGRRFPVYDCVSWIATVLEVGPGPCSATPALRSSWGQLKSRYRTP